MAGLEAAYPGQLTSRDTGGGSRRYRYRATDPAFANLLMGFDTQHGTVVRIDAGEASFIEADERCA